MSFHTSPGLPTRIMQAINYSSNSTMALTKQLRLFVFVFVCVCECVCVCVNVIVEFEE